MIEQADKLNNHAIQLITDGNYSDAITCLKRAVVIDSGNSLLWYNLGVTYRDMGELKNARNALVKAHELSPWEIDITETLATIYISLKQIDEAAELAFNGLDENYDNPRLWNLLGVTFFQKEDYESAARYFEQAVCRSPFYQDALLNLRDTYSELKNYFGIEEIDRKLKQIKK